MQIQFDPRDRDACASVIAIITALHGHAVFDDVLANLDSVIISGDDSADPAAAFGSESPEVAFASPGNVPPAPSASPVAGTVVITPTPPPAEPAPSNAEVDKNGLPWDARIHSGPANKKPKNADGSWRRKRGVDDETVARVEAELRAVMGAPAPAAGNDAPQSAAPPAAPVPAAPAPTAAPSAPPPTPAPAAMESGPAAANPASEPAPTAMGAPATFADLMRQITSLQTAGVLTVAGTTEIAQSLGLQSVRDLMHRADLIPSFAALLPEAG